MTRCLAIIVEHCSLAVTELSSGPAPEETRVIPTVLLTGQDSVVKVQSHCYFHRSKHGVQRDDDPPYL